MSNKNKKVTDEEWESMLERRLESKIEDELYLRSSQSSNNGFMLSLILLHSFAILFLLNHLAENYKAIFTEIANGSVSNFIAFVISLLFTVSFVHNVWLNVVNNYAIRKEIKSKNEPYDLSDWVVVMYNLKYDILIGVVAIIVFTINYLLN